MDYYINRILFPHDKFWHLDEGLFIKSTSKYVSFYNKEAIGFADSMDKSNCLVILGENGIGKTKFLKHSSENTKAPKIWFDFKCLSNTNDIDINILNKDFESLYKKNETVYIFLDGLDEALSNFGNIHYKLLSSLKRYDSAKIKLILSCRTYYFPQSFENELKSYFNIDSKTDILFDITPLSIADIETYLNASKIYDFKKVSEQINLYELKPLLAYPFILPEILGMYNKEKFVSSHNEIYLQGIKAMLSEYNTFRQEQARLSINYKQVMTIEQKITAAGHLALMLIRQNKEQVFIGNATQTPENAINIEVLKNEIKSLNISSFDYSEILSTALFNTADGNTYTFRHGNLKTFLSAYYLYSQNITPEEKIKEVGINSQIIPVFQETASWLAQMDEDFFNLVYKNSTSFLIKSVPVFNDKQNELLIKEIIELLSEGKIRVYDINRKKLIHENLLKQVKSIIKSDPNNEQVIFFCMDLIAQGNLYDLQSYIFKWASQNENIGLKEDAIEYLSVIGKEYYKNKLSTQYNSYKRKFNDKEFDKKDRLRGAYLMLLNSNRFSIKKILDLIAPMKSQNYIGVYQRFLNTFPNELNEKNIYTALKWAIKNEKTFDDGYKDSIAINIIKRAFDFVENIKVFNLLSEYLYTYFTDNHYSIREYEKVINPKTGLSKKFFLHILDKHISLSRLRNLSNYIVYGLFDTFIKDDEFIWLCEQYKNETNMDLSSKLKEVVNRIIEYRFRQKLTEKNLYLLPLYEKFNQDTFLVESFGKFKTRIYKYKQQKWEIEREKREAKQKEFDPIKNINLALADIDTNLNNSVVAIIQYLTVKENTSAMGDFSLSIDNYPVWSQLSNNIQNTTLKAFYLFFKTFPVPNAKKYEARNQFQFAWFVLAFMPEVIKRGITTKDEIKDIATNWAPFILIIPNFDNSYEIYQNFTEFYFSLIPNELIKSAINMIKYNPKAEYPDTLKGFENLNSPALNKAIYNLLQKDTNIFSAKYLAYLLGYLLKNNFNGVLKLAYKLLKKYKSEDEFFIEIATILMCFGSDKTLNKILNYIKADETNKLGRILLSNFIREAPYKGGKSLLSEGKQSTIAEYYIWLYKAFTYEEENKRWEEKEGICTTVTSTDNLSEFRRLLLSIIKNNGYTESIEIIKNHIIELNDEFWFKRFSIEVANIQLQKEFADKGASFNIKSLNSSKASTIQYKNVQERIIVYVEAENDVLFHSIAYETIKKEYSNKLREIAEIDFISAGNKEAVINMVNEARAEEKNNIFGIVDRDYQDKTSTYVKVPKDRYAIENYLVDPLFQLYVLNKQLPDVFQSKYNDLTNGFDDLDFENIHKISDVNHLNELTKNVLDYITSDKNRLKSILKEDYQYFSKAQRKIKYANGITLNSQKWLCDTNAKNILKLFKFLIPDLDVKQLITNFYTQFKLIPSDLLNCYNEIICFNIAYNSRQEK